MSRIVRSNGRLSSACAALLLAGCQASDDGVCTAGTSVFAKSEEGGACTEGPQECAEGLGCEAGVCGACTSASACDDLDGCHAGVCGACEADAECRSGESCREGFCMPTTVESWNLEVDPADWESLKTNWWEDTEYACRLTVDGAVYDDGCVVRDYGETSRKYPKKTIRIELDGDHPGFDDKINLRAEYNDPSYLRTFLGYQTLRRLTSLPVPRTAYRALSVNGTYYGLMLEVERVGGDMLARWGRDPDSSLYKSEHASPYGALVPFSVASYYQTFEGEEMYSKIDGDENDYADLVDLIESTLWRDYQDSLGSASTTLTRTAAAVDLVPHVQYLAAMTLIQNRDHVATNFYLSPQPTATGAPIWEVYPYDPDISFGCQYDEADQNNICDTMYYDGWTRNGVIPAGTTAGAPTELWANMLMHLVLNDHPCERLYYEQLRDDIDSEWWTDRIPLLVAAIEETVGDDVAADPNDLNGDAADYESAVDDVLSFFGQRRAYLDECMYETCP